MMSGMNAVVRIQDEKGGILRRSFVSFDKEAVVQKTERLNKEQFDMNIRFVAPGGYDLPDHFDQFVLVTYNDMYQIEGSDVEIKTTPESCTVSLAYDPQFGERGYCCCSVIRTDGKVSCREGGYLQVEGAKEITIISRTVKYEEAYRHALAEKVLEEVNQIQDSYEDMLAANRAYLEPLMERSVIRLKGDWAMAAEELLNEQHGGAS